MNTEDWAPCLFDIDENEMTCDMKYTSKICRKFQHLLLRTRDALDLGVARIRAGYEGRDLQLLFDLGVCFVARLMSSDFAVFAASPSRSIS
jgi:hypothetical protein